MKCKSAGTIRQKGLTYIDNFICLFVGGISQPVSKWSLVAAYKIKLASPRGLEIKRK